MREPPSVSSSRADVWRHHLCVAPTPGYRLEFLTCAQGCKQSRSYEGNERLVGAKCGSQCGARPAPSDRRETPPEKQEEFWLSDVQSDAAICPACLTRRDLLRARMGVRGPDLAGSRSEAPSVL